MRVFSLMAAFLVGAVGVVPAGAQDPSLAFVDISIGTSVLVGSGQVGGRYVENRGGMMRLSVGVQPDSAQSRIGAIHVALLNLIPGGDECRFSPLGGCYGTHPIGRIIGLTIGVRPTTSPWRFYEIMAGPALVTGPNEYSSFAALVTGRFGIPPGNHVSPGVAFHALVTNFEKEVRFVAGVGVSIRTW